MHLLLRQGSNAGSLLFFREIQTVVNGKYYKCLEHRVVYKYFFGQIPVGLEINHIDGIRNNNRIENLELVTHSQNILHALHVTKNHTGMKGSSHPCAKLTERDVKKIRKRYLLGENPNTIKNDYNVSRRTIENIGERRSWKHM